MHLILVSRPPGAGAPHSHHARAWTHRSKRLLAACAAALGVQATGAAAQVQPPFNAAMQVSPPVASVGASRQISVTSFWPLGCGPTEASVDTSDVASTRTLVIRLARPNVSPCALVVVPYSHVVSYIPAAEGDLRIVVVSSDGELVSNQAVMKTRNLDGHYSQFDVTGLWHDAATYGSGLTLVHARTRQRSDQLFGTWFVYDINGAPRWYTIQDAEWKPGGMEAEGNIYETATGGHECPPAMAGCPAAVSRLSTLGRARIVFHNDQSARIFAFGAGGNVLFTSNLMRVVIQ